MTLDRSGTYFVKCPSCQQKYALNGWMIQDKEELACQHCGALFLLTIDDNKVQTALVRPPTGSPIGPVEGERSTRH
jgi:DNA-directed RNA polymerase subunit RPC12/RpoP